MELWSAEALGCIVNASPMNWLSRLLGRPRASSPPSDCPLWQEFVGRGSSPDIVAEKAGRLATVLVPVSLESAAAVIAEAEEYLGRELDGRSRLLVIYETLIMYVHWIDRLSFTALSAPMRTVFGDVLMHTLGVAFAKGARLEVEEFGSEFLPMHNARVAEYAERSELMGLSHSVTWCVAGHVAHCCNAGSEARLQLPLYYAVANSFAGSFPRLAVDQLLAAT